MRQRFILAGLLAALIGAIAAIAQPPAVVVPLADPTSPPPATPTPPGRETPSGIHGCTTRRGSNH